MGGFFAPFLVLLEGAAGRDACAPIFIALDFG